MGGYDRTKHRQIMIHAETKSALNNLFEELEVRTYNDAIEVLMGAYQKNAVA
jgi:hypothetical protein